MKKLITLLMILALIASLSGCKAHAENEPVHVRFVISPHKYAAYPYVDFTKPDIRSLLEQACVDGSIAAVTVEGTPQYIEPERVLKIDKSLSSFRQNQAITNYIDSFSSILGSTVAKSEETDIIKALVLTGRTLSDYKEGKKVIVISMTGIQTTGQLNMSDKEVNSIDIDHTIAKLKEENLIADLKGCSVSVFGIGDLINTSISEKERAILEQFWKAYFEAAGVIDVEFNHSPYKGEIPEQCPLPNVSLPRSESQSSLLTTGYRLTEQQFSIFKADSAEFVDVYQLKSSLTELIDLLKKNPEKELLICGTTATAGSEEGAIELSQKRAEAFLNLLCELGVHNSMLAIGLGYNNVFHQNDNDEHGKLVPELARANRAVIVLDRSTIDINNLFK